MGIYKREEEEKKDQDGKSYNDSSYKPKTFCFEAIARETLYCGRLVLVAA